MNEQATFFDLRADRWDELCFHDPLKIQLILNQITLRKGARILDVGCGTGILESYLLPYSPSTIIAVDVSSRMIEQARNKYNRPTVDFRCMNVMDLPHDGTPFDCIIAYSVFPHLPEPKTLFAHLAHLLKPGGELTICHSESRNEINAHHHMHASHLSAPLPPAEELAALMKPYFSIRTLADTDQYYMINGVRTSNDSVYNN